MPTEGRSTQSWRLASDFCPTKTLSHSVFVVATSTQPAPATSSVSLFAETGGMNIFVASPCVSR